MTLFVMFTLGCIVGFFCCVALLCSFWRRARRPRETHLARLRHLDAALWKALGSPSLPTETQ